MFDGDAALRGLPKANGRVADVKLLPNLHFAQAKFHAARLKDSANRLVDVHAVNVDSYVTLGGAQDGGAAVRAGIGVIVQKGHRIAVGVAEKVGVGLGDGVGDGATGSGGVAVGGGVGVGVDTGSGVGLGNLDMDPSSAIGRYTRYGACARA